MSQHRIDQIFGVLGFALLAVFIIGLAESISSGLAGFKGGLPFWIISVISLGMVGYDFWETLFRKR